MLNEELRNHVEKNCATYAGAGNCLLQSKADGCHTCPFFEEGNEQARCLYFENAVLPTDDKLKARYWNRFGLEYWESQKVCKRCENPFEASDQREQYSSECKAEQRKEKARIRKREQRKKERQI